MKNWIAGIVLIFIGICLFIIQYIHVPKEQIYVYPLNADEKAKHESVKMPESQLIVDGCSIAHTTIMKEVSEEEAKKMREEAGFSSEGVTGGVIVELKEIGPCT